MFSRTARLERARTRALNEHRIRSVSVHDEDYTLLEWRTVRMDLADDDYPTSITLSVPFAWTDRRMIRVATWNKDGLVEWLAPLFVAHGDTLTVSITAPKDWLVS